MHAKLRRRDGRSSRRRAKSAGRTPQPSRPRPEEERGHVASPTAVAAESIRTGLVPGRLARRRNGVAPDVQALTAGDPDDDAFLNEYVGEDIPGGNNPTPDQNDVDEIGRAYGLQEEDTGALRSGAEVLDRRDRHRSELVPPTRRDRA